jgi:hypothetical protein
MTISKLGAALKRRFPGKNGRKHVASILGIDESLISAAAPEPAVGGNGESEGDDRLKELRTAIEAALSEGDHSNRIHPELLGKILELLKRASPPSVDMARDDETEEERREKFREFLKRAGLGEDDVMKACDIVSRPRSARDAMPNPGLPSRGGMGGATSGSTYMPPELRIANDARLQKRFPGIELVVGEVVDRRPAAMDARPDFARASMVRFAKRYPDAAEIRS